MSFVKIKVKTSLYCLYSSVWLVLLLNTVQATTYQMSTAAGNGNPGSTPVAAVATSNSVMAPSGLFFDISTSNIYIADSGNAQVRAIATNGLSNVFVGTGVSSGILADNVAASSVKLVTPHGIWGDTLANSFISDYGDNKVKKVTGGIITTYAGTGTATIESEVNLGDNSRATSATLNTPSFIFGDSIGSLYIADYSNNRVRKVSSASSTITTVAGTGVAASTGDSAQASAAAVNGPWGVFVDRTGKWFVSEQLGHKVRMVSASGIITTLIGKFMKYLLVLALNCTFCAGNGVSGYLDNVMTTASQVSSPRGIWGDTSGNIFLCDSVNARLRVVDSASGIISTVAGGTAVPPTSFVLSGAATSISLVLPYGVSGDATGRILVSDFSTQQFGSSIRQLTADVAPAPGYNMFTLAGTGIPGLEISNTAATVSQLNSPSSVHCDRNFNIFISDTGNQVVSKVLNGENTINFIIFL